MLKRRCRSGSSSAKRIALPKVTETAHVMTQRGTGQRILVTGANGFIGRALCKKLLKEGFRVRGAVRSTENRTILPESLDLVPVGRIDGHTDWSYALPGIEVVVHLAARAHRLTEDASDPLTEYRRTNVDGTVRLARAAAAAGVHRIVFMSSIGVLGQRTTERPFAEHVVPDPQTPYAISKHEAELVLREVASGSALQVVIVRSPLVYGPENPGNFYRLLKLVAKGWPLPFASIRNSRSLIYIGNLVDALKACIVEPQAAGQVYCVSDGENISTPDLIRGIAAAMRRPSRLYSFPPALLVTAGKLLNKSSAIDKLISSLVVDTQKIEKELHWKAPFTVADGLKATADWYVHMPK